MLAKMDDPKLLKKVEELSLSDLAEANWRRLSDILAFFDLLLCYQLASSRLSSYASNCTKIDLQSSNFEISWGRMPPDHLILNRLTCHCNKARHPGLTRCLLVTSREPGCWRSMPRQLTRTTDHTQQSMHLHNQQCCTRQPHSTAHGYLVCRLTKTAVYQECELLLEVQRSLRYITIVSPCCKTSSYATAD